MKLEIKEVQYIARLSRLHLSEDDAKKVSKRLSVIVEYMSKLEYLDSESKIAEDYFNQVGNIYREDVLSERISRKQALSQSSSDTNDNYFRVPKVIS